MRRPDQTGLVGMVVDRLDIDLHTFCFQDHPGASDRQFPDLPLAHAPADEDAFRIAPGLRLQEPANDERELLGKIFDRTLHEAGGIGVFPAERRVELLFADLAAGLITKWIGAKLAQRSTPFIKYVLKCFLVGAVANEAILVLQLDIVAVDFDRRQAGGAMDPEGSNGFALVHHGKLYGIS